MRTMRTSPPLVLVSTICLLSSVAVWGRVGESHRWVSSSTASSQARLTSSSSASSSSLCNICGASSAGAVIGDGLALFEFSTASLERTSSSSSNINNNVIATCHQWQGMVHQEHLSTSDPVCRAIQRTAARPCQCVSDMRGLLLPKQQSSHTTPQTNTNNLFVVGPITTTVLPILQQLQERTVVRDETVDTVVDDRSMQEATAWDVLQSIPDYSLYTSMVNQVGATVINLLTSNPVTVFVPTNAVVTASLSDNDNYLTTFLLQDASYSIHLRNIVQNHLASKVYASSELQTSVTIPLLTESITVQRNGNTIALKTLANTLQLSFNMPTLTTVDKTASNGVVQEVGGGNTAIVPYWYYTDLMSILKLNQNIKTFLNLINSVPGLASRLSSLKKVSVALPNNAAFAALSDAAKDYLAQPENVQVLERVLLYHIIPDQALIHAGTVPLNETLTFPTLAATTSGIGSSAADTLDVGLFLQTNGGMVQVTFNNVKSTGNIYLTKWNILHELNQVLLPPGVTLPDGTAPVPAPVAAPVSSPVQMPVSSPVQVPVSSPVQMPVPAPVQMPVPAPAPTSSDGSILAILQNTPTYSTFAAAIAAAGYNVITTFEDNNPLTVFAPSNSAIAAAADEGAVDYLNFLISTPYDNRYGAPPSFSIHLRSLLYGHATTIGALTPSQLFVDGLVLRLYNQELATVREANDTTSREYLSTLANNLRFTTQAPFFDGTQETQATNGYMYPIDRVILPYWYFTNVVTTVQVNPQFSTFLDLAKVAGLMEPLSNLVNATVLLPNNEAFSTLDDSTRAFLTDPNNVDTLRKVLLYHVIPSGVINTAAVAVNGKTDYQTLADETVTLYVERVNGPIKLRANDVMGTGSIYLTKWNIMYELTSVLVPPSVTLFTQGGGSSPSGPSPVVTESTPTQPEPAPVASPVTMPVTAPTPMAPQPQPLAAPPAALTDTLLAVITNSPDYSVLSSAILAAGQSTMAIFQSAPLTVFAPRNTAFWSRFGSDYGNILVKNKDYSLHLRNIVLNHVTSASSYSVSQMTDSLKIPLSSSEDVTVRIDTTGGSNAVVKLETLAAVMRLVNPVPVTVPDKQQASNGILHEVGDVMTPWWFFYDLFSSLTNLNPRFTTLKSLVVQANLEDAFKGARNATLAAPTNEAFAALPASVLTYLTDEANVETLRRVLLYHLIPKLINIGNLPIDGTKTMESTYLSGEVVSVGMIMIGNQSLKLQINEASSTGFIFLSKWGIMYEMTGVLIPPGLTIP